MGTMLELLRDGTVMRVLPIGDQPVSVGAHLSNQIAIDAPDVSAQHALITQGPGGLVVIDVGSTNGTRVNGERITGPKALKGGDRIGLGATIELRVRTVEPRARVEFVIRELDSGLSHSLRRARTVFGSGDACHVHVPDGAEREATVVVHGNEVWLGTASEERELAVGEPFELGGSRFELAEVASGPRKTMRDAPETEDDEELSYHLTVDLGAAGGPTALIKEPGEGGSTHMVTAENRATLLYVLAKKRVDDLEAGEPELMAGWCDDEEVAVGVWGRAAWEQSASRYSVLIHRVRKELDSAGFDPWFIEKRRGATRIALSDIELV